MADLFVDGIKNVSVQGPIARVELANFSGLGSSDEDKLLVCSNRLVMPVETLIRLHQTTGQVIEQLETKGLIKKTGTD